VRALLCALLLALAYAAPAAGQSDVRTYERAEWNQGWPIDIPGDEGIWTPVSLPHNWYRSPAELGYRGWYRLRHHLDYVPLRNQSIYIPKLVLGEFTLYVNQQKVWRLSEHYSTGTSLTAVLIAIPGTLLRPGENVIHLQVRGSPEWFHGISRIYVGDTNALAERAALRSLIQGQMIHIVAAAFGAIGLLSLWLWLRAGRDPVLFWYGVSGVALLVSTAIWYVTMWRADIGGWRLGLIFMRFHGYLLPLFILHLRLAGRRLPWLEGAMWLLLTVAIITLAVPGRWQSSAWHGWGMVFAALPALLTVPLLSSPQLRAKPAVLLLVVADFAASLLTMHDWVTRFGFIDFEQPYLIYFAPLFVMLAAAMPILERMLAGVKATEQMNVELEHRVAEKAREIEASHERLRQAQREQTLAEERRRIMADMHDGLGARLVSLLSVAQSGDAKHGEISEGIAAVLDELRLTIDSVQPVEGDVGVVLGNVRHRMRSVFERAGVQLVWNVSELPRMDDLTPERILAIQRIFLETFSNAIRHSGARTVSVFTMRVPGAVRIVIEDDGHGFDPAAERSGTGLGNLRLRAAQAGGTLSVESQAGKGTRVTLSLPVPGEPASAELPNSGQEGGDYPVRGISADATSA